MEFIDMSEGNTIKNCNERARRKQKYILPGDISVNNNDRDI